MGVTRQNQKFKVDKGSPLWNYTTMLQQLPRVGRCEWNCHFCKTNYRCLYYQVRHHFCGPTQKGIKMCVGLDQQGLFATQIAGFIREQEDAKFVV